MTTAEGERGETCTLLGGAATHIFGYQKFSASLVNGQKDSSRHIICLNYFLYSSYSRNHFSHKKVTHILFPNVILILSPKVVSYLTNEIQGYRAVGYDDIYRMAEIKSLSFHIMFYRLFCGVAKYIVYGNTFS